MDYALCIIGDVETGGMESAAVSKKKALSLAQRFVIYDLYPFIYLREAYTLLDGSLPVLLLSETVLSCGAALTVLPVLLFSGAGLFTRGAGCPDGPDGSGLCTLAGWLDGLEGSVLCTIAGEEFLLSG
ncbi:MAG: hypothetical protein H6Q24_660, partial [Bacteroidetes bacterium]|nr:hypothetical protein [Bacteroidota bacterium]